MATVLLDAPNVRKVGFAARWAIVGACLALCLLVFRFLLPEIGTLAGAVTLLPTLMAAMLLRTKYTLLTALTSCAALNLVTWVSFEQLWAPASILGGVAMVVGIGVMVARMRELQERVSDAEHQRSIAEARARLSTAERLVSLGTLAAGIAHEVNNPLAFILANLRYARGSIASGQFVAERDEVIRALEESETGAQRMHAIVSDMKRLARDGATDVGEADPRAVVRSALNLLGAEARATRIETSFGSTPMVAASEARLGQIVLNLVINALQSFEDPRDSNLVSVRVSTDERGWAVIDVADNGAGIPAAVQKRIFDPFFTTKPPGVGTGLGLPLCQTFVHGLGGTISFDTEPGRGTTFTVSLPPSHLAPRKRVSDDSITKLSRRA
jgi:signal transduction histidine kinase